MPNKSKWTKGPKKSLYTPYCNSLSSRCVLSCFLMNPFSKGNINTVSQKKLFDISREIFELTQEIKEKIRKIKQKSTEVIALEASIIALEVASLAAMAGNHYCIVKSSWSPSPKFHVPTGPKS